MQLNNEQQDAAHAQLENIYVTAGAGAGKTRVLIARIMHMITELGVSPSNIMAITYTRKAAKEMKERLERESNIFRGVTMATIHGFCLMQLFRFGDRIGWNTSTMSVFSDQESKDLLKWTLEDLEYRKNGKRVKGPIARDIKKAFLLLETEGVFPPPEEKELNLIISKFYSDCRRCNCLTYPMILGEFLRLLNEVPEVFDIISNEYRHVLMDEVQDTTPIQWMIVKKFLRGTMFVTGDARQSIFSFSGASPSNTQKQTKDYKHYNLACNYRSGRKIVDIGNTVMDEHKPMVPMQEGGIVEVIDSDSTSIHGLIGKALRKGYGFGDIAILCRAHKPLAKSVKSLQDAGCPVYYPKAEAQKADHPDTKLIHAYLALQVNPFDVFAFRTLAPFLELSPVQIQTIRAKTAGQKVDFIGACCEVTGIDLNDIPWSKINPEIRSWIFDNLDSFSEDEYPLQIHRYLQWYAMRDIQTEQEVIPKGHVQALSCHQAKGLEWPCVILIGASEGILPTGWAKSEEDFEEECRVFYVAVTRAENMLIVSPRPESLKSRFVKKIYPEIESDDVPY